VWREIIILIGFPMVFSLRYPKWVVVNRSCLRCTLPNLGSSESRGLWLGVIRW
jgi:hypothetical protein